MKKLWRLRRRDYADSRARRLAFRAFLSNFCRPASLDDPELVFGELVTNAVRYGDDPMSVSVDVHDAAVKIQVDNAGDCFDLEGRLLAEPRGTNGRGLHIVRALSDELTVEHRANHRCRVTAVLAVEPRAT